MRHTLRFAGALLWDSTFACQPTAWLRCPRSKCDFVVGLPFPTGSFIERLRRKVASRPVSAPMTAEGLSVRIAEYRSPTSSHVTHFPVLSVLAVGDYEEVNWRSSLPLPPNMQVKSLLSPLPAPFFVLVSHP